MSSFKKSAGSGSGYFDGSGVASGPITGDDTLEIRDGTDPQNVEIYSSYTDASNYERLQVGWDATHNFVLRPQAAGTGSWGRTLNLLAQSLRLAAPTIYIGSATGTNLPNGNYWIFDNSAANTAFYPGANNARDFGKAANTIRTGYFGTSVVTPQIQGANTKALTESSATAFVQISVAQGSFVGGYVEYTIHADDATDFQARSGTVTFAAVNKAGTETITLGTPTEAFAESAGGSTLSNSFTATAGTDAFTINADATSSLTQTTLAIKYRVVITSGTATVTAQ